MTASESNGADFEFSVLVDADIPDLIEAIADIGRETDAHNKDILDLTLWQWQYRDLPTGEGLAYLAKHDGKIVGYYHVALYDLLADDQTLRIGQIQSVAVSPSFRGQGLFRRLADYAHQQMMDHVDLIYTFPNRRSIRTFLKYNDYKAVTPLPMFVLPLATAEIIRGRKNLFGLEYLFGWPVDMWGKIFRKRLAADERLFGRLDFNTEMLDVFAEFQDTHGLRLRRDAAFMNWRYLGTPKGQHYIIALERGGQTQAVAVLKYEQLFNATALLVVDFAHRGNATNLIKLLSNLPSQFNRELPAAADLILCSALTPATKSLKRAGFLPVPQKLIPRQLNLLARWMRKTEDVDIHDRKNWLVTLGDWDVF